MGGGPGPRIRWMLSDSGRAARNARLASVLVLLLVSVLAVLSVLGLTSRGPEDWVIAGVLVVFACATLVGFLAMTAFRLHQLERDRVRATEELHRLNADLEGDLEASRSELDRTVAMVNDLFWTLEVRPDGVLDLAFTSKDASGVLGGDVPQGMDAATLRAGMVHPDDAERSAAFSADLLEGRATEVEERLIGVDGVTRWTWSRATPRREGDRLIFDGITTNVTERHEIEAQRENLLKKEREQVAMLEEMHRSRDDFIALAGHELRTPLTVIQGYAEHLIDDPRLQPEHRQQLEIVVRRAGLMSELVDDLFDLAKLDAHVEPVKFNVLHLDQLLREWVRVQEPVIATAGVSVRVDVDEVCVLGEPVRLHRMFDNLLGNAVKFSPDGGEVRVSLTRDGDRAVLRVSDHGIGIPPEDLPHVFDRLFRAENALEGHFPGTGLGLSIAAAIADTHSGTMSAAPAPQSGTIVTVALPAHDCDAPPAD